MTSDTCAHLGAIPTDELVGGTGCEECLRDGTRWVHLRRCTACGHIGCCDSSPMRHATAHHHETSHPIIQSFEPDEDWLWCYVDEVAFELDGRLDSPSHP